MKQQLQLQVSSCGSAANDWKQKPKRPLVSKVIQRDRGDFALILAQDFSKPLRYLYLKMLLGKNTMPALLKIIKKIDNMKLKGIGIQFQQMTFEMKKIGCSLENISKQLIVLRKKLQKYQNESIGIIKLIHEYDIADSLLILSFRAIASNPQLQIKNALQCNSALSLKQIEDLLTFFGYEKLPNTAKINRFILFTDLTQIQCQYLKSEGIVIQNQANNYQQLSDPYPLKYSQNIMIQKLYSLI